MDFTREPIIETVITPREGYRLVVRSSKNSCQEEHFVEALEVISFGSALFFRCVERPKPFIVPVSDYEVLEVREARMVLKTPIQEKMSQERPSQEKPVQEKAQKQKIEVEKKAAVVEPTEVESERLSATPEAARNDRRRDRRRSFRKRRGQSREEAGAEPSSEAENKKTIDAEDGRKGDQGDEKLLTTAPLLSAILPPPTRLIRDDLPRLKDTYKGALFIRDEKDAMVSDEDDDALLAQLRGSEFIEKEDRMSGDQEVSQEPFQAEPFQEETFQEELFQSEKERGEDDFVLPHDTTQNKKDMESLNP